MGAPTKLGYWRFLRAYRGMKTTLKRAGRIYARYGLTHHQLVDSIRDFIHDMGTWGHSLTLPVTARLVQKYPNVFRELAQSGVEFAIHGLAHLDYTLVEPRRVYRDLCQAVDVFDQVRIPATGFRFPYLRHNQQLLQLLEKLPLAYDSSVACFWSAPLEDLAGGNGVLKRMLDQYRPEDPEQQPVLPRTYGRLIELPVSLPDDDILRDRVQLNQPAAVSRYWIAILRAVHVRQELFVLQLHPERYRLLRTALAELLAEADVLEGVWVASLGEIARWWKRRLTWQPEISLEAGQARVTVDLNHGFDMTLHTPTETHPDTLHWQETALPGRYRYQGERFPFIGLGRRVGETFEAWLKSLGFIPTRECSARQTSVFLAREPQVENRRLWLKQFLENLTGPLLQLRPWPAGYRCALAVTGDIDALTIQDFFNRLYEY